MDQSSSGRVLTFYSFKGGVGRSMALANVAFLASMNGMKVLVMDWDLEAPGVGYYFRGLMEAPEARALRTAPGILDLAWDWVTAVRTKSSDELASIVERFVSGALFTDAVRSLIDPDMIEEDGARLDILRAGRDTINAPTPRSYEEALSEFSWTQFFRNDAGGVMLSALRDWARTNYDLVLIDSRTGLADVAGVCTMQLPDEVALCFVLNRQNIEGVARIAGAIRSKRSEQIRLRALPMRVARENTPEEIDARARARKELVKIGGFAGDAVDQDFRTLAVAAAANVPFYESLACIVADDPATDALALNYLRLASDLTGRDLRMPELYPAWVERVRRRLQPRHATADYLLKLKSSVPERAFEEIMHLVDAALDTILDHESELDDDYLDALVAAALEASDPSARPFESAQMVQQAVDIIRALAVSQPNKWRSRLIEGLQRLLDMPGMFEDDEEVALLEELDSQLNDDPTYASRLERLRYRRRLARIYVNDNNFEAAFQVIADIASVVSEMGSAELSADQRVSVQQAEADTCLLRSDIYLNQEKDTRALSELRRGIGILDRADPEGMRADMARMRFELYQRLATRFPDLPVEERAHSAIEAASAASGIQSAYILFRALAQPVLDANDAGLLGKFLEQMLASERLSGFANYSARQPRTATGFFLTAAEMVERLVSQSAVESADAVARLARLSGLVARLIIRRRTLMPAFPKEMREALRRLIEALGKSADPLLQVEELRELEHVVNEVRPKRGTARSQHDSA